MSHPQALQRMIRSVFFLLIETYCLHLWNSAPPPPQITKKKFYRFLKAVASITTTVREQRSRPPQGRRNRKAGFKSAIVARHPHDYCLTLLQWSKKWWIFNGCVFPWKSSRFTAIPCLHFVCRDSTCNQPVWVSVSDKSESLMNSLTPDIESGRVMQSCTGDKPRFVLCVYYFNRLGI